MSSESLPPEPWHSFLRDLDEALQSPARLDCIGGFVVTQLYGLDRPTADVDVIELAPREASETLMKIATQGGTLHRKHRIYLDRVGVAAIPENYEERLTEMFPGTFRHLRLMALDPYEDVPYAIRKAQRRVDTYVQLGIKVTQVTRNPR